MLIGKKIESYFGKDAHKYKVLEYQAEIRYWDMAGNPPQRLYYFKAKIVLVSNICLMRTKKLLASAGKLKKKTTKKPLKDSKTFCIALADFQIGKEGTEEAIERFIDYIPKIRHRLSRSRK